MKSACTIEKRKCYRVQIIQSAYINAVWLICTMEFSFPFSRKMDWVTEFTLQVTNLQFQRPARNTSSNCNSIVKSSLFQNRKLSFLGLRLKKNRRFYVYCQIIDNLLFYKNTTRKFFFTNLLRFTSIFFILVRRASILTYINYIF